MNLRSRHETMNDTRLNRARELFEQGLLALEQGQPQQAEQHLQACLQLVPGRVSPLVALGVAQLRLNQLPTALTTLDAALAQDGSRSDAWGHRADALLRLRRPAEALQSLDHADGHEAATAWHRAQAFNALGRHPEALGQLDLLLARDADHAATWLDRARTLQCLGRHGEAGPAYQRAVQLDATLGPAWTLLGQWYQDQGQPAAARQAFEQALALGDDPELNRWFLAALPAAHTGHDPQPTPERPPHHYVEQLFDGYAASFDQHLVHTLGYQAPQQLAALLAANPPVCRGAALDLGCGTGLCAALLQAHSTAVDGVDLSGAMIKQAQSRGVYRHLHQAEVVQHLQTTEERYAVLVAADVLIYIGSLQPLFAAARRVLLPGGVWALTVEVAADGRPFELRSSLRYAHSPAYLHSCAAAAGLRVARAESAPLRLHEGQPLQGLVVLLALDADASSSHRR